jgi:uncharacterized protein YndB with AHSA1/START domain
MTTKPNSTVRITRYFPFPAERVFDAWLDPVRAAKWLFATPGGQMVRAEVDPRVGGRFTFTDRRDGEDIEHTGEYLEIDRPRRLAFTFGVPKYSKDFDRVTIEISSKGKGCELALIHETGPEWKSQTIYGWTKILQGLAAQIGDRRAEANLKHGEWTAPGEARFVRLLPGPIERVWDYLTNGEKRAKWFAGGPMELRVGGKVDLLFRHSNLSPDEEPPEKYREVQDPGVNMTGEITQCEPPRLLGFTWEGDTPDAKSEVIFQLTPIGEDVELVLTHRRLGSDAERVNISGGWQIHTAILDAILSGSTPPPLWAAFSDLETFYGKRLEQSARAT